MAESAEKSEFQCRWMPRNHGNLANIRMSLILPETIASLRCLSAAYGLSLCSLSENALVKEL